MITLEIMNSDLPFQIGVWEYHWNKIAIGGPKGLHFCSTTHPSISISIYKSKYLLFESEHFIDHVTLNGRKVSFPFVAQQGNIVETKYFTILIKFFSEEKFEKIDATYKSLSDSIQLGSPEAELIKKILDE